MGENDSQEGFLITRAVLITMSVAFAYIILVVGLMIWCRYRRQARKARLNENNPEAGEVDKLAENEPCLSENKTNTKSRKSNGNNNPKGNSAHEAQKSDDTACSNHSKTSKKSNVYDQLSFPRSGISELLQVGRGEFGDVFVGKIKSSLIKHSDDKDTDTEKNSNSDNGNGSAATTSTTVEKRRSKTSMDDIEEIKEEQETCSSEGDLINANTDEYKLVMVKALNKIKDENACQEFRRQIEMFRTLTHKGVVRLYGLCREKDPHYMVLEYTDWVG